ncbi:MAG: GNAT family N-acetyltransferase [Aeromonas sp.]
MHADRRAHHPAPLGPCSLVCRAATLADAPAYRRYVVECAKAGLALYQVAQFDPDAWLQHLLDEAKSHDHAKSAPRPCTQLPTTTYFALQQGEIIATLRLRHGNNEATGRWLGHIGYETRPSRRGEGAASTLLRWLQQQVLQEPVRVACLEDNWASCRVIAAAKGRWLARHYHPANRAWLAMYQIDPNPFTHAQ